MDKFPGLIQEKVFWFSWKRKIDRIIEEYDNFYLLTRHIDDSYSRRIITDILSRSCCLCDDCSHTDKFNHRYLSSSLLDYPIRAYRNTLFIYDVVHNTNELRVVTVLPKRYFFSSGESYSKDRFIDRPKFRPKKYLVVE